MRQTIKGKVVVLEADLKNNRAFVTIEVPLDHVAGIKMCQELALSTIDEKPDKGEFIIRGSDLKEPVTAIAQKNLEFLSKADAHKKTPTVVEQPTGSPHALPLKRKTRKPRRRTYKQTFARAHNSHYWMNELRKNLRSIGPSVRTSVTNGYNQVIHPNMDGA